MLKNLQIQHFQSHDDTKLGFSPGVNIIVGKSDSGKSSIIRALKLLVWNRPLGDSFISYWSDQTSVKATLSDGFSVERRKGKDDCYLVTDIKNDKESIRYEKFGQNTPDDVGEVLNISEINLQQQMDNSFLMSNNPGEVARHFNEIANIDKIDSSLKYIESEVRSINSDKKECKNNIEKYVSDLEQYDYLDDAEQCIENIEQLSNQKEQKELHTKQVSQLVTNIYEISDKITKKSKILQAEEPVVYLLQLYDKRQEHHQNKDGLEKTIKVYNTLTNTLESKLKEVGAEDTVDALLELYDNKEQLEKKYKKLQDDYTILKSCDDSLVKFKNKTKPENDVNYLIELHDNKEEVENKLSDLQNSVIPIYDINDEYNMASKRLDEFEQQWHDEAPEKCPLCEGTGKLKDN